MKVEIELFENGAQDLQPSTDGIVVRADLTWSSSARPPRGLPVYLVVAAQSEGRFVNTIPGASSGLGGDMALF